MEKDKLLAILSLSHILVPFILGSLAVAYLIGANPAIENKWPAVVYFLAAVLTAAVLFFSLLTVTPKKITLPGIFKPQTWNLQTIGLALVVFFATVYIEMLIVYLTAGLGLYP